jgi:hypothetical protein
VFKLGQAVKVKLDKINFSERKIDFFVVDWLPKSLLPSPLDLSSSGNTFLPSSSGLTRGSI